MNIKKINNISSGVFERAEGSDKWYWCSDFTGDLYEAEEIANQGKDFEGTDMSIIRYPDGKVFKPFEKKKNIYINNPVADGEALAFLAADFYMGFINIFRYFPERDFTETAAAMPIKSLRNCYNLRLVTSPLTLCGGDCYDGKIEIVWPEKAVFDVSEKEILICRDNDIFYFNEWFEDPEYREEISVRDIKNGKVIKKYNGSMYGMPDGSWWII